MSSVKGNLFKDIPGLSNLRVNWSSKELAQLLVDNLAGGQAYLNKIEFMSRLLLYNVGKSLHISAYLGRTLHYD